MQRVRRPRVTVVGVGGVLELGVPAGRARPQRVRRDVHDQLPLLSRTRPERDRVRAAVRVDGLHLVTVERVRGVIAQVEDPHAFPPGRIAVIRRARSSHWGLAIVRSTASRSRSATPLPLRSHTIGSFWLSVTREIPDQPRSRRTRDVEDPHPAARSRPGEAGVAGVVADERVVSPEREIGVRRLVRGREHLVHLVGLIRHVARARGSGQDAERQRGREEETK